MLESNLNNIRYLYYLNWIASVTLLVAGDYSATWLLLTVAVFFLMNPIGVAITYHRYWAHKSFTFKNKAYELFCSFWPLASGVGSILGWVGMHRDHHIFSDTDDDPHKAANGFLPMVTMSCYKYNASPKKVVDMLRDDFVTKSHKYYFAIPLLYAVTCYATMGMNGLVFGFCFPAALSLFVQNLTNYVNHLNKDGFRPSNVAWINLFNFGDGWHKNHHDKPLSYTTKETPSQYDPAGWVIENILASELKHG